MASASRAAPTANLGQTAKFPRLSTPPPPAAQAGRFVVQHEARQQRQRRGDPFSRLTSTRMAGACRFRVHRHDRNAAEAAAQCRKNVAQCLRPPDQGQRAAGLEQSARGVNPVSSVDRLRLMRRAAIRIRRRLMPSRIVERRVHQHAVGAVRREARRRQTLRLRRDVERDDAARDAVQRRVLARERGKAFVDLDQRQVDAARGCASASPAAPTPAPNSTTRSPGAASVAAASSIASWPARWPCAAGAAAAGRRETRPR